MFTIMFYLTAILITLVILLPFYLAYLITKPFDSQRLFLHRLSRLWTRMFFGMQPRWKIKVEGLENIEKGVPYVVVVNHNSMLDIPMMYCLPFNFKWVAKREVYKLPIFGWVLRMHGDIAIDRGSSSGAKKMMKEADHWLRCGTSVIVFPEGTRSHDGEIHKFKDGAFLMAKHSGVAILPCVVDGTGTMIKKGWRLKGRHRFTVRVLPAVSSCVVEQSDVRELATHVREQMVVQRKEIVKNNKI